MDSMVFHYIPATQNMADTLTKPLPQDTLRKFVNCMELNARGVMNIEWDYSYYQPWSDNEWLVDEMIAMREETLTAQSEDITMQ